MKKVSVFRCLYVTLIMIASFFMFSRVLVQAEGEQEIVTKTIEGSCAFNLKAVYSEEDTSLVVGYNVVGVTGCEDVVTIEKLVVGGEVSVQVGEGEESFPILGVENTNEEYVGYNEEDSTAIYYGVFDGLKGATIKKIIVDVKTVDNCAFCNLNVEEIVFSRNVTLLKDQILANSSVTNIYVNRHENDPALTDLEKITSISNSTFLNISNSEYRIVFVGGETRSFYLNRSSVWKDNYESKCTYKMTYTFCDGNCENDGQPVATQDYYFREKVEKFPKNLTRVGFDFIGWFDKDGNELKLNELLQGVGTTVFSRWELSVPEITIGAYVGEDLEEDNKITYFGKDTKLDIKVNVVTSLPISDGNGISYSWRRVSKVGINNNMTDVTANNHSISLVSDSGTYYCKVTIEYDGYKREFEVSIDVDIEPRDLKIKVANQTVVYGTYVDVKELLVDSTTPLVEGEEITMYTSAGFTNNHEEVVVGEYEKVLDVKIDTICRDNGENCEGNYVDNYNIIVEKGNLTVTKKHLSVGLYLNKNESTYGDAEVLEVERDDTVYGDIVNTLKLTYFRENPTVKDVGVYEINAVSVDNSNYTVSLDSDEYVYSIVPKEVKVLWNYDDNLVYTGEAKSVRAYYKDIEGQEIDLDVSILKDGEPSEFINAGTYNVSANLVGVDSNYTFEENTDKDVVIIGKAKSVIEYLNENNSEEQWVTLDENKGAKQWVTYNGEYWVPEVRLNHNETVADPQPKSKDGCKDATSGNIPCEFVIYVAETDNYYGTSPTFQFFINKYTLEVEPTLVEAIYGASSINLKQTFEGLTVDGVTHNVEVQFMATQPVINVGEYDISSREYDIEVKGEHSKNYKAVLKQNSGVSKIKVNPKGISILFMSTDTGENLNGLVYNGKVKTIGVTARDLEGLPLSNSELTSLNLTTRYEGNKVPKNAGNYKYIADIDNDNYKIVGSDYVEFSIAKASYDVSNLKLVDKKVKFNFKGHSIVLEGEVPEGVSYYYELDGKENSNGTSLPFKHKVKVHFVLSDSINYHPIDSMEATLYIDMTWVFVTCASVVLGTAVLVVVFMWLYKEEKIRFVKRIKKSTFRRIISKNKALLGVNEMISSTRKELEEEEVIDVLEEPVKFVKTEPIIVSTEIISKSFVDELFRADPDIKEYYSELKNELLSYEGITSKIKRDYETFYLHNLPVARIDIEDGVLYGFYALDPTIYKVEEYKHENVSKRKEFGAVPLKLRIDSLQSLRHAKMFVRIIRKRENIKSVSNFVRMDYAKVYTVKENTFHMFKKVFEKKNKKKNVKEENSD